MLFCVRCQGRTQGELHLPYLTKLTMGVIKINEAFVSTVSPAGTETIFLSFFFFFYYYYSFGYFIISQETNQDIKKLTF